MPRPFLILALILAFSGTPFRLAEAADDLARSLAGPEVGGEFEVVNGGVGDDSGETVRAEFAHDSIDAPSEWVPTTISPFDPPVSLQPPGLDEDPPFHPPASSPPSYIRFERFLC